MREVGRDYCRGCDGESVQTFAGWATSDGHENSARPRAFYRRCTGCGTMRLVLGWPAGGREVNDAEGLCRSVLQTWLRRNDIGAAVGAIGRAYSAGNLDAEDGLSFLQAEVWKLYLRWEPARSEGSFLAYATALLPRRLAVWSRDASGEVGPRRKEPKAHAASVSVSRDQRTVEESDDEEGFAELEDMLDLSALPAGLTAALATSSLTTRRAVLLVSLGYSQREAADLIGVSESAVGQALRKLEKRARDADD